MSNETDLIYGSKVLVVDDKKENLDLITRLLEEEGYEIAFAMSGEKAIQIASLYLPDLILLDVMMPGIDGFETCQKMKALKDLRDIPIIFVTGKAEVTDIVRAFKVGAVDYITKPIRHEELSVRVSTHLQLRRLLKIRDDLIAQLRLQNIELKKLSAVNEKKLEQSEKMNHLGELVGELTHELATPVGIAITAISTLADHSKNLEQAIAQEKLSKSKLTQYLSSCDENYDIVLSNLKYVGQLVDSFKQIIVGEFNHTASEFELSSYLSDIVHIMTPKLKRSPHSVTIDCESMIYLTTQAGALSQVLINLVNNALIHAFVEGQHGKITLSASLQQDDVVIGVCDDGRGVDIDSKDKIFDKYFTSKGNDGGSGLGLYIVKNLVENTLNGTITCQSEENKGTLFTISIPHSYTRYP